MAIVTFVVVEHGSEAPSVGTSENAIVGYYSRGLLRRTLRRLDSLRRQGDLVRVAEIVCSDRTERALIDHRAEVAMELLRAVASRPGGSLVLRASDTASAELRSEMLSLAGMLSSRLPGTVASVSVRFGVGYEREGNRLAMGAASMAVPWQDPDLLQAMAFARSAIPPSA